MTITRPRRVFGRRFHDGFRIEMRADGIYVRRKHARRWEFISFDRLIGIAAVQMDLALDHGH